jgi:hypothetical protein
MAYMWHGASRRLISNGKSASRTFSEARSKFRSDNRPPEIRVDRPASHCVVAFEIATETFWRDGCFGTNNCNGSNACSEWDNLVLAATESQGLATTILGNSMLRLLVTLLLFSSFGCAQEVDSAASAAGPQPALDLPVWSTKVTQPNRYISAHGIRGCAGLEFWSFPLQLVSGYHLSFVLPKAPTVSAISTLTSIEVDPLGVTRIYTAPDFRVRERITTHAEDPGVLVRFTVEGRSDLHIQVHFQPSLNLMWPAGIGGQETSWDQDARGFLLSEPTQQFRALISSPEATEHSEMNNDRRGSDFDRSTTLTLDDGARLPAACQAEEYHLGALGADKLSHIA